MTSDDVSATIILVDGTVQRVGFRSFTERTARRFSIVGFVENMKDGTVKILAQGSKDKLGNFVSEIKNAPEPILVESILSKKARVRPGLKGFEIVVGTPAREALEGFGSWASVFGDWGKEKRLDE